MASSAGARFEDCIVAGSRLLKHGNCEGAADRLDQSLSGLFSVKEVVEGLEKAFVAFPKREDIWRKLAYFRRTHPGSISSYASGLSDLREKKTGRALTWLKKSLRGSRKPAVTNILIAYYSATVGDFSGASRAWERVVSVRPGDIDALILSSLVDIELGELDRPQERLRKARSISRSPNIGLLLGLGRLWWRKGSPKRALRYLLPCLDLDPDNPSALSAAVSCYSELKRYKEAVPLLEHFWSVTRENQDVVPRYVALGALFHLAAIRITLEDYDKAINLLEFLTKEMPIYLFFSLLGFCCAKRYGAIDRVRECYLQALRLNPRSEGARCWLAWYYSERHEYDLAMHQLSRVRGAGVNILRGFFLAKKGIKVLFDPQQPDFREAKKVFTTCLEYDELKRYKAEYRLIQGLEAYSSGWVELQEGRPKAALRDFSRAKSVTRGLNRGLISSTIDLLRGFLRADSHLSRVSSCRSFASLAQRLTSAKEKLERIQAELSDKMPVAPAARAVVKIKTDFVETLLQLLKNGKVDHRKLEAARKKCLGLGFTVLSQSMGNAVAFVKKAGRIIGSYDGDSWEVPKKVQTELVGSLGGYPVGITGGLVWEKGHRQLGKLVATTQTIDKKMSVLIESVAGIQKAVIEGAKHGLTEKGEAGPPGTEGLVAKVEFMGRRVLLNSKPLDTKDAWRMLEYFMCKNDWVYYWEGYLIFPGWSRKRMTDPRNLFREKTSKAAKYLWDRYKIKIEFEADPKKGGRRWKLARHNLETNIPKAGEQFRLAKAVFQKGDYLGAKTALVKAREVYPNHLSGLLLLARCYEELRFEDISADEIENTMWPLCHSLRERRNIIENLRALVVAGRDSELQEFLNRVENHPLLSQIEAHTSILERWLREKACSEDELTLAKVKGLLKTIVAADEGDVLEDKVRGFLELPCVDEVLRRAVPRDEDRPKVIGLLFFADVGEAGCSERLRTMSKVPLKTVGAFKKYLWKTVRGIVKDMPDERLRKPSGAPRGMRRRIAEVDEVESDLSQQLGGEPSEDELREELKKRYRWNTGEIDDILDYRRTFIERREEFLAPKKDIQPEENFFGQEEEDESS